jgi:hypothetical protein
MVVFQGELVKTDHSVEALEKEKSLLELNNDKLLKDNAKMNMEMEQL